MMDEHFKRYLFCPKCGTKISETASFCGHCGFSAFAQNAFTQNEQVNTPYNYDTIQNGTYPPFTENYYRYNNSRNAQNPRKMSSWLVALIVLLVIIFVVIPAVFSMLVSKSVMSGQGIFGEDFFGEILPETPADKAFPNSDTADPGDTAAFGESLLPNGVSVQEYRLLEIGMSYAQVSFIIGGDALAEDTDNENDGEFVAVWPGEQIPEATVSITFVDDKVTGIKQVGLF